MTRFTESVVEEAALAWLESVGWRVLHGVEIAPGELAAERGDYGELVLALRLDDPLLPNPTSGELRGQGAEPSIGGAV